MTDEEKDILMAKMLNSASELSDSELELILHDEELADIYNISSEVRAAYKSQIDICVDKEWQHFKSCYRPKRNLFRRIIKAVAIFTGVVLLSGVLIKSLDYFIVNDDNTALWPIATVEVPKEVVTPVLHAKQVEKRDSGVAAMGEPKKCAKRAKRPRRKPDNAYAKVTKNTESVDVDEYLRIQQACLDNVLALQTATAIEADILAEYDYTPGCDAVKSIEIVTMQ